jgi:hypothetical protein
MEFGQIEITNCYGYLIYELGQFTVVSIMLYCLFRTHLKRSHWFFGFSGAVVGLFLFAIGRDISHILGYPVKVPFLWWQFEWFMRGGFFAIWAMMAYKRVRLILSLYDHTDADE